MYCGRVNSERLKQRERIVVEGEDLTGVYIGRGKDRGISGESKRKRASTKGNKGGNVPAENEKGAPNPLLREKMRRIKQIR